LKADYIFKDRDTDRDTGSSYISYWTYTVVQLGTIDSRQNLTYNSGEVLAVE